MLKNKTVNSYKFVSTNFRGLQNTHFRWCVNSWIPIYKTNIINKKMSGMNCVATYKIHRSLTYSLKYHFILR
jgi:hypothetical protein